MTRFRMASGVVLLWALHCWAAPAAEKVVYLSETDERLIKELVLAEVWRPGGANSEALAEVLEGFLKSGNLEAATLLIREARPYFFRRLLDPTPLAAKARQVTTTDKTIHGEQWHRVRDSLANHAGTNALSQGERFDLYSRLIADRVVLHGPFGMTYWQACWRGLWENPAVFLAEVENACPDAAARLRVARARISPSSLEAVVDLVDAAVKAELRPGELVDGIAPDELLEEALLALLMDKQTKAVARLKRILLAIPVADRPQGLSVEGRAALVAKGRMDSEPPRDTHAGRSLVRAIRALGDPTFQSKNLQFEKSLLLGPEHSREELRNRGLLKAEPE